MTIDPSDPTFFELRHYVPSDGKLEALKSRFADVTFRLFERHGFELVGFWTGQRDGHLWYLLRWKDSGTKNAAWASFLADNEWQEALDRTERDGPLVARIESILLDEWK